MVSMAIVSPSFSRSVGSTSTGAASGVGAAGWPTGSATEERLLGERLFMRDVLMGERKLADDLRTDCVVLSSSSMSFRSSDLSLRGSVCGGIFSWSTREMKGELGESTPVSSILTKGDLGETCDRSLNVRWRAVVGVLELREKEAEGFRGVDMVPEDCSIGSTCKRLQESFVYIGNGRPESKHTGARFFRGSLGQLEDHGGPAAPLNFTVRAENDIAG